MPGRNDWSGGFTKSANKVKFIRHRDVKMKDSELRKEAHITKAMCEGICPRCREKLQWKFKYDKYKPLKNPANCQECKQKRIVKAYRTLCDPCATKKKACAGCCVNLAEAILAKQAQEEAAAAKKNDGETPQAPGEVSDEMDQGDDVEQDCDEEEGEDADEMDDEDDEEEEGDEEGEEEESMDGQTKATTGTNGPDKASLVDMEAKIHVGEVVWNAKKFSNYATNKYSKARVVGKEG